MDTEKMQDMAEQGMEQLQSQPRNVGDNERLASLAGGAVLALMALRRGGVGGLALGALGGMLLYRGATGHCAVYERMGRSSAKPTDQGLMAEKQIHLRTSMTIDRSPEELYTFWRNFENLPQFMRHIVDVTTFDDRRSHWVAQAPFGNTVEWDAEVVEDVPNERIKWQSSPDATVRHHGEIRFRPAAAGRGTEVEVEMRYEPPGGRLGATVARYFNGITKQGMQEDLRRFKQLMETGEIPTAERARPAAPSADSSLRH